MSVAALLGACGDGVIDGPATSLPLVDAPIRIDPRLYPELATVGGRAVLSPLGKAPMVVETTAVGQYAARSLVCPHSGTVVDLIANGYLCPNHGARFAADGSWIGGTQTADLSPVGVQVASDGALLVGGAVVTPAPPALVLSQSALSFTTSTSGSAPPAQAIDLSNSGGGSITGLSLSLSYGTNQPSGWLAASLSALQAPAQLTVGVNRGTLAAGSYSAVITVTGVGASNAPPALTVTLVITDANAPAALQLSRTTLALATPVGGQLASQAVQVLNSGSGTIGALGVAVAYGAGATGWLAASLSANATPTVLTLAPNVAALAVGTYTANVTVSGAGVAAKTLSVSLTVVAAGLPVTLSAWPALANIGGVAGSVGTINFSNVAVVRTGAASFAAFSLSCPHEGYGVQVINGQSFRCPRHGATWNSTGALMSNSPLRTSALVALRVSYTPGDTVLYVS
jgi:Rieske Fe-S protein